MRTLVISNSPDDPVSRKLNEALRSLLADHHLAVATFDSVEEFHSQTQAELVFVVLSPSPEPALDLITRWRGEISGRVVAVGEASDSKLILRTLRCGADHYLDQAELESELKAELSRSQSKPRVSALGASLVGILSASGGCGASTVAVNVAAALAREHEHCVLIDLHPRGGDSAALLDLKPQFTLADLCRNLARLDTSMFEKILVSHSSGIRLLGAPPLFSDAGIVTTQGVVEAISMARRSCPQVVIDLEDCFHNEQIVTLHQATGIFLVCRLDFTSLRNVRRMLEHLDKQHVPRSRIRLVINQFGKPNDLPVHEAEDALGEKLALFIPDDSKTICGANNAGVPAVLKDPGSKVAQSLAQLAKIDFERVNGSIPTSSKAAGPLTLAFRKKG